MTVHTMPSPAQLLERRRTLRGRLSMLAVLAACAAPVVASYFTYYFIRPGGSSAYSTLIQPTVGMPPLQATAPDGRSVPLKSLAGQWLLVAVGPGDCAGACEKRLYLQRQLREMLGRERTRIDKLWLVVDDAALQPALAQALAATDGMHVLRLPRDAVAAWLRPSEGQALEDHLYIVDPMGEWMMRVPPDPEPARVKRDLDRLLRASGSWDRPGR